MNFAEAEESARRKFFVYRTVIEGIARGELRHALVCGGPGLGKSYTAEQIFSEYDRQQKIFFEKASGHMTPLALYNTLYESRGPLDVVLFDDCDAVFKNPTAMNILKAATDSRDERRITWASTTGKAVTPQFLFQGRVVIITNLTVYSELLAPLIDRVLVCPVDLTEDERAAHVVGVLHKMYGKSLYFDDVSNWLVKHRTQIGRKLTVRTAIKVMELAEMSPSWQLLAVQTILAV